MRAWGRGALPINKMSSPSSFGRRFVLYVEPCHCRVRVMGKKKKKIRKGQLFKSTRFRVRTRWHIVSNDWLWFEYCICMLIILQTIFTFWEATGELLFLTWHMVNKTKKKTKWKTPLRAQIQPTRPCGSCNFQDESLGTRCTSNKQNVLAQFIWAQICVVRGTVSLQRKGDGACNIHILRWGTITSFMPAGQPDIASWYASYWCFTLSLLRVYKQNHNVNNKELEISLGFRPIMKTHSTMWKCS